MESITVIANYTQRIIYLIFYTFLTYNIHTLLLRPIFNTLYPIYYYQRFHSLPKKFLLGNILSVLPKFPFPSSVEEICLNTDAALDTIVDTNNDRSTSVLWLGPFPIVLVSDHEAVEAVMTKSNLDKPFFYKFIALRNGLVTSDVALWKIRRKAIEPFHVTKRQRRYVQIMDEEIKSFPKLLAQWIGKPVDIEHSIHSSSLNVICKISASIPLQDLPETKKTSINIIENLERLAIIRIINPLYWFDSVFKFFKVGRLYFQQIDKIDPVMQTFFDRRAEVAKAFPSINEDHDLIHFLEPHANHDGLVEELMTTLIAGHNTVSVCLRWTLFILGNHPDIQERLYQEVMDHFPGDEPVNDLDKLNQCTYLDQCLKESLRLFPPIHSVGRVLTEDVMVKGKKLLKGTSVLVCIKTTHRDPSVYPDPTKYDPERWSPENVQKIPRAAFIPFAYGPRNCIGFRYAMIIMKVYLVHVLRQFSLKSTQKETSIRTRFEISFKPDSPLEIILSPRNDNNNNNNYHESNTIIEDNAKQHIEIIASFIDQSEK